MAPREATCGRHPRPRRRDQAGLSHPGVRGFTLVEIGVVVAVVAVLTAAAWPSWRGQLLRSRRVEATTALMSVQRAQAGHYTTYGRYAQRLDELAGAPRETAAGGHYRVAISAAGADGYRAVAVALAGQADDRACAEIELRVRGAISEQLPSARCWLP